MGSAGLYAGTARKSIRSCVLNCPKPAYFWRNPFFRDDPRPPQAVEPRTGFRGSCVRFGFYRRATPTGSKN